MLSRRRGGDEGTEVTVDLFDLDAVEEDEEAPIVNVVAVDVRPGAFNPRKTILVGFTIDDDAYVLRFVLYDETFNLQNDSGTDKERDAREYVERQRSDGRD